MTSPVARIFRALLWTGLALLLLDVVCLRVPMVIARIHISHLLADFQSIQPMQSNWADAQRLMHRWGRWGHHDRACTAVDCSYVITVEDPITNGISRLSDNVLGALLNHGVMSWLSHLGYRETIFVVGLTVQDGIIVRTHTNLMLEVSPYPVLSDWNKGYSLVMKTQVHSRLTYRSDVRNYVRVLGPMFSMPDQPDEKVGRPGGCTICMAAEATYTPTLSHREIVRITSYRLGCLTSLQQCLQLEDLLPAAEEWHLYDDNPVPAKLAAPAPCTISPRALGRDADIVFEADVLDSGMRATKAPTGSPYDQEINHVRVVSILKGKPWFHSGQTITIAPFHVGEWSPEYASEHLTQGRRSILLMRGWSPARDAVMKTDPCGVIDDTPETLQQVQFGISQDVLTRYGDTYDNEPPEWQTP